MSGWEVDDSFGEECISWPNEKGYPDIPDLDSERMAALVIIARKAERYDEAVRLAVEVRRYGWSLTVPPDRPEGAPVAFAIDALLDLLAEEPT